MSRLTRDEILDIEYLRDNKGQRLLIKPSNYVSFMISDKHQDYDYYYQMFVAHFTPVLSIINSVSGVPSLPIIPQLPSGTSIPPNTPGNISLPIPTPIIQNGNTGFNWGGYTLIMPGFDSEDTSPEFQKAIPSFIKETTCSCGVWTTYGKDYPADKHSDWCDIYKEEMKLQSIKKITSEDVPF